MDLIESIVPPRAPMPTEYQYLLAASWWGCISVGHLSMYLPLIASKEPSDVSQVPSTHMTKRTGKLAESIVFGSDQGLHKSMFR